MCCRRRTRPQDGRRRVPTREKNRLTMLGCWAKRTEKTPYDDPRAPPRGVHPGARGRRRRNREPKVSHVSLWVAPGRAGGHPRPRSPSAVGHGPWRIAPWPWAPWACGALPQASVIRVGISREGLGRWTRAEVPGRRSPGWGVPGEEAKVLDCLPWAQFWRPIW